MDLPVQWTDTYQLHLDLTSHISWNNKFEVCLSLTNSWHLLVMTNYNYFVGLNWWIKFKNRISPTYKFWPISYFTWMFIVSSSFKGGFLCNSNVYLAVSPTAWPNMGQRQLELNKINKSVYLSLSLFLSVQKHKQRWKYTHTDNTESKVHYCWQISKT